MLDSGRPAPGQGVPDALSTVPVTLAGAGEALLLRPAPVAVDDQPDVTGQRLSGELAAKPPLVELDGQAAGRRTKYAERSPGTWREPRLTERHGLNLAGRTGRTRETTPQSRRRHSATLPSRAHAPSSAGRRHRNQLATARRRPQTRPQPPAGTRPRPPAWPHTSQRAGRQPTGFARGTRRPPRRRGGQSRRRCRCGHIGSAPSPLPRVRPPRGRA